MACLAGPSFHEGSGSWAQARVWLASATTRRAKVWRRNFILNYLGCWRADIAATRCCIYSSICRELPNAAFHCLLRGELDCSLANDLSRDCFGVVGRIARMERFILQIYNSKLYTAPFGDLASTWLISQSGVASFI